jgi:hypothetical protein
MSNDISFQQNTSELYWLLSLGIFASGINEFNNAFAECQCALIRAHQAAHDRLHSVKGNESKTDYQLR